MLKVVPDFPGERQIEILRHGEKQSLEDFVAKERHLIKDARFTLIEMIREEHDAGENVEKTYAFTKVV